MALMMLMMVVAVVVMTPRRFCFHPAECSDEELLVGIDERMWKPRYHPVRADDGWHARCYCACAFVP
jgi:hypothetical protein